MIKVLHFYKTYYPNTFGGVEQVIYQIAEGGLDKGVESTVLSLSKKSMPAMKIGKHDSIYSKTTLEFASTPLSLSVFKDFARLAEQADIIHYHFPWPLMDIAHFVCRIKKPSLVSYHSDIVKQKSLFRAYKPLMNAFFNSVDHIVASSPNYVASSQTLQQFKNKVTIIPYGLDERSHPEVSQEKRDEWFESFGNRFFLFIGAFRYYKGLHVLIEAAKDAPYPVVIVGSGALEAELKKQAQASNTHNIHFVGAVDDIDKAALLQLCSAIVFPSHLRSESFGITLLEGAMYSKPMISCEIGSGTTYVNIADKTGLVTPPDDPKALREAMDKLWFHPELAEELGQNAGKRYREIFTAEQMADKYIQLYKAMLKRS
jgi:glycosyltransferase involved in cell wall biosynthesis